MAKREPTERRNRRSRANPDRGDRQQTEGTAEQDRQFLQHVTIVTPGQGSVERSIEYMPADTACCIRAWLHDEVDGAEACDAVVVAGTVDVVVGGNVVAGTVVEVVVLLDVVVVALGLRKLKLGSMSSVLCCSGSFTPSHTHTRSPLATSDGK